MILSLHHQVKMLLVSQSARHSLLHTPPLTFLSHLLHHTTTPSSISGNKSYPFGGTSKEERFAPSEPEMEYRPHPQKTYTSSITMQAPANFKPIPLQPNVAPRPAPPQVPPKPFKDTSVFQNVDTHAVEVS